MRSLTLSWIVCAGLTAQTQWTSAPVDFERLPGNAGVSMPARWAVGTMQVLMEGSVLPAALTTTPLRRVRLRRAAFAADPADPPRTLDCELRLADSSVAARHVTNDLVFNRPPGLTVVAARRTYSIPAAPALGPGDAVGADLIDLPLDAPFTFQGPNLFVEWQNFAPAQNVSAGHWVDAVHLHNGADVGIAVGVGAHGCGSRGGTAAMSLQPDSSAPPVLGTPFPLLLRNALPGAPGVLWLHVSPLQRNPLGLPFGHDLSALNLRGCFLWAGPDAAQAVAAGVTGDARADVTVPDLPALRGRPVSVQVITLDPQLNPLSAAVSSGVVLRPNSVGVADRAVTVLEFRANSTLSPWAPFLGLVPVFLLGS